MRRVDASIIAHLMLIAVTVVASVIVGQVLIEYTRKQQIGGEVIAIDIRASRSLSAFASPRFVIVDVSISISCSGEQCERYTVSSVEIYGFCDQCDPNYQLIGSANFSTALRSGVTILSAQAAVDAGFHVRYITVVVHVACSGCEPSTHAFHVSREFERW